MNCEIVSLQHWQGFGGGVLGEDHDHLSQDLSKGKELCVSEGFFGFDGINCQVGNVGLQVLLDVRDKTEWIQKYSGPGSKGSNIIKSVGAVGLKGWSSIQSICKGPESICNIPFVEFFDEFNSVSSIFVYFFAVLEASLQLHQVLLFSNAPENSGSDFEVNAWCQLFGFNRSHAAGNRKQGGFSLSLGWFGIKPSNCFGSCKHCYLIVINYN